MPEILFGKWAPGMADTTPGHSPLIDGAIPKADGRYGPYPQLVTVSGATALSEAPRGQITFPKASGAYAQIAAISDTHYLVSQTGGLTSIVTGRSVPSGDRESFIRFGTKVLASNTADGMNSYDVESDTDDGAVSGAPAARELLVCGDTVVALDCDGDNRLIQNSDINDHTNWTSGAADYQPVEDGGALVGGVAISDAVAIIFQREAIRIMQFGAGGGGALYSLRPLTLNAGAVNGKSIVEANGAAYFMDTDGPKVIAPGMAEPRAIGAPYGIDRWMDDNVDSAALDQIEGAYDRFRRMVMWRVPVSSDTSTVFSKMLGYHIDYDAWGLFSVTTSAIFPTAAPGFTWSDLTGTWDSYSAYTWGARSLQGGEPFFAGFDGDFKLATFTGSPMAVTAEISRQQFRRSTWISSLTPITDAANATVAIGAGDRLGDDLSYSAESSINAEGDAMFDDVRGKALKARLTIPAGEDYDYFSGFDHPNAGGR